MRKPIASDLISTRLTAKQFRLLCEKHYRTNPNQFSTRAGDRAYPFYEAINMAMTWSETPQGHGFWEQMNNLCDSKEAIESFLRNADKPQEVNPLTLIQIMETTDMVLLTDGNRKGTYVPQDEAVALATTIYDGFAEHQPHCHTSDSVVTLCKHSEYGEAVVLEEDAIDTVDGYVLDTEDVFNDKSDYYDAPILQSRMRYHNIVALYDGGYACTDSDYVHYGFVNSDDSDWFFDRHDNAVYSERHDEWFMDVYIAGECGFSWDDSAGDYRKTPKFCAPYGDLDHPDYSNDAEVTFGIEVEKICWTAQQSVNYRTLYDETGFAKEEDGSCPTSEGGFEMVSPIYSLQDLSKFIDDINIPAVKQHMDAKYDDRCGGHFTVASKHLSATDIYISAMGFFPLLYALYPKRTTADYSRAKCKFRMLNSPDKRSAVYIKGSRLCEFRIFPAVRDTKTAVWRAELMQIILKNPYTSELEVLKMITNKRSELAKHLRSMYRRSGKAVDKSMLALSQRFVDFARQYNSVILENHPIKNALGKK